MRLLRALSLLALLPLSASAARTVMEGIPASRAVIHITTGPAASPSDKRVHIATMAYGGVTADVGLFSSSNVVVSDTATGDKCVIYATGSIACVGPITGSNTSGGSVASGPSPSWQGINYLWQAASGTVIYSTGTTTKGGLNGTQTGIDSFHLSKSSFIINGTLYLVQDTLFTMPRSSYAIVWINTSGMISSGGLRDLKPSTISSYTTTIGDGVVVALASSSANGDIHLFYTANENPLPSLFFSDIGNGIGSSPNTTNGGAPTQMYDCNGLRGVLACETNTMDNLTITGRYGGAPSRFSGNGSGVVQVAVTVNNTSGSTASMNLYNYGASNTWCVSLDGTAMTCNTTTAQTFSIPTGYHTLLFTRSAFSGGDPFIFQLPPNVKVVRPGYW